MNERIVEKIYSMDVLNIHVRIYRNNNIIYERISVNILLKEGCLEYTYIYLKMRYDNLNINGKICIHIG